MRSGMMKILAAAVQATLVMASWAACSNNPGTPGDGGSDAPIAKDSTYVDKSAPDVSQQDVNSSCGPNPVDSTQITWSPPHAVMPTACSDQDIADYVTCSNSTSGCNAWAAAHPNCNKCMVSTEGDPTYGVIINTPDGFGWANIGGCIATLTGDLSATGCGAAQWKTTECEDNSCAACVPVDNTGAAFFACQGQADTSTCTAFYNAGYLDQTGNILGTACASLDAGAVAACATMTAQSFGDYVTAIATVMCGGYPADAGTSDGGPMDAGIIDAVAADAPTGG